MQKRLLDPTRVRRTPGQFSGVDQRRRYRGKARCRNTPAGCSGSTRSKTTFGSSISPTLTAFITSRRMWEKRQRGYREMAFVVNRVFSRC